MPQYDVTASGAHLQNALVTPTNTDPDETLGGLVARGLQSVTNIAALRAWARKGPPVYVEGHTVKGDGGDGLFFWDAADATKMVSAATIASGGTGYVVGLTATLSGGTTVSNFDKDKAVVYITAIGAGGSVTGIEIVRWGRYTATPANSVAVETSKGSGLTINATWANTDNDGTIVSPAGTAAGRWIRQFRGPADVRWFGAKTTGDARPGIQKALAYHYHVYIPAGTFTVFNPIVLFDSSILEGESWYVTRIYASSNNIGKPIIIVNPKGLLDTEVLTKRVEIKRIAMQGYCTSAIVMVRGTYCLVDQIRIHNTFNTDHAFILEHCWNTRVSNIQFTAAGSDAATFYTPPAGLACMWIGRFASALMVENLITSSKNPYGILMEGSTGTGVGQFFYGITLQGHTEVGFYIRHNSSGPTYVHGLFTELCKVSMRIGDFAGTQVARAVHLSGCALMTSAAADPGLAVLWLDYVHGVDISACTFGLSNTLDNCAILFNQSNHVRIAGGCYWGSYPVDAVTRFRRYTTNSRADVQLVDQSMSGNKGGVFVMRPDAAGTGNYDKIVKLSLDVNGAWVPVVASIPVHANA